MKVRVFTCNKECWPYQEVQQQIDEAKRQLSRGINHISSWSCGNIKQIQAGDQAYFYRVGSEPRGFFALGRVVTAEIEHQSRLNWSDSQNLSEAYTDIYGDLRVNYEWYSVVDYDKTLSSRLLKTMPEFANYNFLFRQSGMSFREEYVELLDSYWKQHILRMSMQGYGVYTPPPTT